MNFGFIIFDDAEELDFVGPWEMATMWGKHFGGPDCFIISQEGQVVTCAKGLKIVPDYSFATCPDLDYLIIPGGFGTRQEAKNPVMLNFVQERAKQCAHVLSVCTGSFVLKAAGLLNGKKATTYWGMLDTLRQDNQLEVVEERFVRDGNIWTAAGVSAGIDLLLAFIADQAGEQVAGQVQLAAEYYPNGRRYGEAHFNEKAPAYLKAEHYGS